MRGLHLLIAMCSFAFTNVAVAKRHQREGFNFGLGVRALSNEDTGAGRADDTTAKREVSSQALAPHAGFTMGENFALGLQGYFENEVTDETFKNKDGSQVVRRETNSGLKGGGLYSRFMFAEYLHFEAGVGFYERKSRVTEEYETEKKTGGFSGERETYSIRGVGPGYHGGVGMEFPVVQGFFFSTDFNVRTIKLLDYEGDGSLGKKSSSVTKRELMFGLSHYID